MMKIEKGTLTVVERILRNKVEQEKRVILFFV